MEVAKKVPPQRSIQNYVEDQQAWRGDFS